MIEIKPINPPVAVKSVSFSVCFSGELVGHKDLVSGFSFCQHAGQSHICVSSSSDGSIRFWDSSSKTLIRDHAAHQVSVLFCRSTNTERGFVLCLRPLQNVVCSTPAAEGTWKPLVCALCCLTLFFFFHIYLKWSSLLDETGPLTRSGDRKLSIRARQDSVGCAAKTSSAAALWFSLEGIFKTVVKVTEGIAYLFSIICLSRCLKAVFCLWINLNNKRHVMTCWLNIIGKMFKPRKDIYLKNLETHKKTLVYWFIMPKC